MHKIVFFFQSEHTTALENVNINIAFRKHVFFPMRYFSCNDPF